MKMFRYFGRGKDVLTLTPDSFQVCIAVAGGDKQS